MGKGFDFDDIEWKEIAIFTILSVIISYITMYFSFPYIIYNGTGLGIILIFSVPLFISGLIATKKLKEGFGLTVISGIILLIMTLSNTIAEISQFFIGQTDSNYAGIALFFVPIIFLCSLIGSLLFQFAREYFD